MKNQLISEVTRQMIPYLDNAQMEQLQKTLDLLNYKCWFYETAKAAGSTDAPKNIPDDQLPENIRRVRHECSDRPDRP